MIQDKNLKRYLKLHKSNIIVSEDDSENDQHDFEVEKGYFSSSSSDD